MSYPETTTGSLLLLPFQLALLVILHSIFALARLVQLVKQLPSVFNHYAHRTPPSSSSTIDDDSARWSKTPKNLAVVFVPGLELGTWSSGGADARRRALDKLVTDVSALVGWCVELGVESLSLYDEHGVLDRNAHVVIDRLSVEMPLALSAKSVVRSSGRTTFHIALPQLAAPLEDDEPMQDIDSGCAVSLASLCDRNIDSAASSTLAPSASYMDQERRPQSSLTVNLLSRESGRPHLAKIAQDLALAQAAGVLKPSRLANGIIEETIDASAIAEPDLLLVLGGPNLRLRGFPPWQLRLTEMYHHSSPSWLPSPPMSYCILRKSLDLYGLAEMRVGR